MQLETNNNKTSRGILSEAETIAFNLQSVADHLAEIPELEDRDREAMLDFFSKERQWVINQIVGDDVDIDWHCAYKHCLMAVGQMTEIVQSLIKAGQSELALKYDAELELIRWFLNTIRMRYFKIDSSEVDDVNCPRCLSDYLLNKLNGSNEQRKEVRSEASTGD